jgi:hypothetical protein
MRLAQLCFILAGVAAASAAGLAVAQTQYLSEKCFATPGPIAPSQCGCPEPSVKTDFCLAVAPPAGWTEVTYYYCASNPNYNCTSPNISCGGNMQVVSCTCWTCDGSGGYCGPQAACTGTQGKNGSCVNLYGCSS